ncbi:hypothetical protein HaLaN_20765, partial [Haematococcus lacustris]
MKIRSEGVDMSGSNLHLHLYPLTNHEVTWEELGWTIVCLTTSPTRVGAHNSNERDAGQNSGLNIIASSSDHARQAANDEAQGQQEGSRRAELGAGYASIWPLTKHLQGKPT